MPGDDLDWLYKFSSFLTFNDVAGVPQSKSSDLLSLRIGTFYSNFSASPSKAEKIRKWITQASFFDGEASYPPQMRKRATKLRQMRLPSGILKAFYPCSIPTDSRSYLLAKAQLGLPHCEFDYQSFEQVLTGYLSVDMTVCNFLVIDNLRRMIASHAFRHQICYAIESGVEGARKRIKGWTRTRVLILVPTRETCCQWIKFFKYLAYGNHRTPWEERFLSEFSAEEASEFGHIKSWGSSGPTNAGSSGLSLDYVDIFGGNNDDNFKIGIRMEFAGPELTPFVCPYTNFYDSDVIIATPLGLKLCVDGADNDGNGADFLSSIEILVLDRLDVLATQSYEHAVRVLEASNVPPRSRGNDFNLNSLRPCHFEKSEDYSASARQVISLSSGRYSQAEAILTTFDVNDRGSVKLWREAPSFLIQQNLARISLGLFALSTSQDTGGVEVAFKRHFIDCFHRNFEGERFLIVVPSILEFHSTYKALLNGKTTDSVVGINETLSEKACRKRLREFSSATVSLLLITERLLFYRRPKIRGYRNLVLVGPPASSSIYLDLISSPEDKLGLCLIYWDVELQVPEMERIVGLAKIRMLQQQSRDTLLKIKETKRN